MPERRRARLWVAGILGGAVVGTAVLVGVYASRPRGVETSPSPSGRTATGGESSDLAAVNQGLRDSDPSALKVFHERTMANTEGAKKALTEQEAAQTLESLAGLRTGFLKFNPPARATIVLLTSRLLEKFTPEPAPASWLDALRPVHDILSAGLADSDSTVRFATLGEISRFWVWMPGRSLTPVEEKALAEWKEGLHRPVVRCLASTDVRTRIGAISCLGYLPIDSAAAPALAYLEDKSDVDVRRQTVVSFSQRPALLTDDMLLKRTHDEDAVIRETVRTVLQARGLTQEQISLGSLILSPKPEQRASVIPGLQDRTDIDPVVWLLQLSHDTDETVRVRAVEALASHKSQSVTIKRRLAEMARSDASRQVRETASKFVPSTEETTASLPPLPGSSSLNPKAN